MKTQIGKRVRVSDIKSIWGRETEFSQWLTTEDGLTLIAQDIGIEIENPQTEVRSTDFSCDVVGNLLGDEQHIVVIENQFEKTNHDHLGKFLTYAAVHKAMTGIWIAERAADDHRQVIDWLNENTPDTVNLFLAELKAYRIGDSPVAPQLDVVCRPNMMQKMVHSDRTEAEKLRYAWRQLFWEDIQSSLKAINPPFRLQKPSTSHWSNISIGRSGFHLGMLLLPKYGSVALELYIQPIGWKESAFQQLLEHRPSIESELETETQWYPLPEKKSAYVRIETRLDPKDERNRQAVIEWFTVITPRAYRVFKKHVLELREPE